MATSELFRWNAVPLLRFAIQSLEAGRTEEQIRQDILGGTYGLGTDESPVMHLGTYTSEPQEEQIAADVERLLNIAQNILTDHDQF